MRRLRYSVAMSLDGYIAGPNGEADWIPTDPDIDFGEMFQQFDTILVGRRTFEPMAAVGRATVPGMRTIVCSRTLRQADYPGVTVLAERQVETVAVMKMAEGKDIWLFGGGSLFRSLAEAALVDTVEVSIVPILLGEGVKLVPGPADRIKLAFTSQKVYRSGIVSLQYEVKRHASTRYSLDLG
ncbi:MAG TPA: dihydrofolate reductase family protein [Bryobacteraceae bacterium]|nr:dihydrofolate reductase family protein [Bryobacteraceae bacterium]